ncbi:sigma 54-interacting transcriptional regulator [Utexia brackfieldae]|uniref:sigma 54-interacting transcriptional regulator n=1 Tax=Utexia brackfieldae TaxID=3074108 RepID=UPI00370D85B6
MESHFSPVAIIATDRQNYFLSANPAAIALFSLVDDLKQTQFDYKARLNLPDNIELADVDSQIIVLNGQHYFLQISVEADRHIFLIQPLHYLTSRLAQGRAPALQAFDCFAINSKAMQQLIAQAKAFSRQLEPLLISGETGSGKDLLALACHHYSSRGDQIFLGLNCAALPDEVVESELYGHAPGAYPGAIDGKKGFFEQANGGSVLLDGIDEMSPRMQTKLLRFINDGTFRRVGDDNEVSVNVRIICATKENLYSLVEKGLFREDLYYRLNVLPLNIPPLRERHDDIIPLTNFFVTAFANKQGNKVPVIADDVIPLLLNYVWPGNVRQLKNILYSALAQLSKPILSAGDITLPVINTPSHSLLSLPENIENRTLDELTKQFEKTILTRLYVEYPSSRKLSKRLGLSHTAVANKLREYGIHK